MDVSIRMHVLLLCFTVNDVFLLILIQSCSVFTDATELSTYHAHEEISSKAYASVYFPIVSRVVCSQAF